MEINVKKRNGRIEDFSPEKINAKAERVCEGLENVSASELVLDAKIQFYDKIPTSEIDTALILTARSKIYLEPNYSFVAARLLLDCIYKEVLKESFVCETFEQDYRSAFVRNIKKGVKSGLYSPKLLEFDLKLMSESIQPQKDELFKYVGLQNIYDRYLIRQSGKVVETPQAYFMRIAMGLSINEKDKDAQAIVFYNTFSDHLSSPSTPTLFNSGTVNNQLSSCFLSEIDDSVDGIFDGLWQEARKSKYAGGLGFHVSSIRAAGAHINGTNGKSSGIVPWLKVYNDMLIACDQAGKRQGSGCAYLEPWHLDVEDFIDLRKSSGEERRRTHDLNIALWCCDLFFKRIKADGEWTLFCPSSTPDLVDLYGDEFEARYAYYEEQAKAGNIKLFKIVKAKELWKKILKSLFETSHPWITFKDAFNKRYTNIHEGVLHGSNLCTEIGLHSKHSEYKDGVKTKVGETAVCNLHSLCMPKFIENGKINKTKLAETIKIVIRALDNVIDINFFPTLEARNSNEKHRPIGMGNMGNSDVFQMLGINQDSDEAVTFTDELTEFISYHAIQASCELAKERGAYSTFKGSKWDKDELPYDTFQEMGIKVDWAKNTKMDWGALRAKIKEHGMRNSNVLAIAPNASIAYQLGVEQSIEPNFSALFRYENKSGSYFIINFHFVEDAKKLGIWNSSLAEALKEADGDVELLNIPEVLKRKYSTAFSKNMFKLIEVNAARQKWIDQAISFNMYNASSSIKYLNDIYLHAWEMGLKSTYYLRNKPASTIQKMTNADKPLTAEACSINSMKTGETCIACEG